MPSPLLSIVIPVFNRTNFLKSTLRSVIQQSFQEWQIIVVDDGSLEDVEGVVNQISDPRIRFVKQVNQGNAVARNTGIGLAEGSYIICLDSDDIWSSDMLQDCVDYLESHQETDVVYVQHQRIDETDRYLNIPVGPEARNGDLLIPLLMGFAILPSSALVRRRCFERWGGYKRGLDDWELWLRWSAKGCRFTCLEKTLLFYRLHGSNYHLNWVKRRDVHFAMLNEFYSQNDLPEIALKLKDLAYISQHLNFVIFAQDLCLFEYAGSELAKAINNYPELLHDPNFYNTLIFGSSGRGTQDEKVQIRITLGYDVALRSINVAFTTSLLSNKIFSRKSECVAWMSFVAGRSAYSMSEDKYQARKMLVNSLRTWPAISVTTDWLLWFIRSLLTLDKVIEIKKLLRQFKQ